MTRGQASLTWSSAFGWDGVVQGVVRVLLADDVDALLTVTRRSPRALAGRTREECRQALSLGGALLLIAGLREITALKSQVSCHNADWSAAGYT
jgi:hypothetical protein